MRFIKSLPETVPWIIFTPFVFLKRMFGAVGLFGWISIGLFALGIVKIIFWDDSVGMVLVIVGILLFFVHFGCRLWNSQDI